MPAPWRPAEYASQMCQRAVTSGIEIVLFAVILVQRMGSTGIMQTLSLVTSWSQGAIKYSKLILLKDLIPYSK